jgi:hypothetical protein
VTRPSLPFGPKLALGGQLALALLFLLLGWSHTVSLAQGRAASLADILALALPLVLVLALGLACLRLWRAGRTGAARLCAFLPWPLALAAFMLLGAV